MPTATRPGARQTPPGRRYQRWSALDGCPGGGVVIPGESSPPQALRILLDLALTPYRSAYFGTAKPIERAAVRAAMDRISAWNRQLTQRAPMVGEGEAVPGARLAVAVAE